MRDPISKQEKKNQYKCYKKKPTILHRTHTQPGVLLFVCLFEIGFLCVALAGIKGM